jgi:hypothetical protein
MKRILINYLFALFWVFPASAQYVHDNLGNQYQKRTIEMGDDYEGRWLNRSGKLSCIFMGTTIISSNRNWAIA